MHQRLGVTSIFVTHDQEEAMSISDRIAIMHAGRIEQIGTPEDIYERPATRYVASFIGNPQIDLVPARVEITAGGPAARIERPSLEAADRAGPLCRWPGDRMGHAPGACPAGGRRRRRGTVRLVQPVGPATHVTLDWEGGTLIASTPGFVQIAGRQRRACRARAGTAPDLRLGERGRRL